MILINSSEPIIYARKIFEIKKEVRMNIVCLVVFFAIFSKLRGA